MSPEDAWNMTSIELAQCAEVRFNAVIAVYKSTSYVRDYLLSFPWEFSNSLGIEVWFAIVTYFVVIVWYNLK